MRRYLLALLVTPAAAAQTPDLSGTWAASTTAPPGGLAAAPSPVFGARFGLRTSAGQVAVVRPAGEVSMETTIPLNGTRVATPLAAPACMAERTLHETATWEGEALVVTVVGMTPAGGGNTPEIANRTIFRRLSVDQVLVEGTMVQQGQRRQVGTVYTHTADHLPPLRAALPVPGVPATIDQVSWIGTTWAGTTNGITTEERWTPPASGAMIATARTLRGPALAAFEFLCIAERSGRLVYFAMPNARMPATMFVATEVTPASVTFENPAHDYPKVIRYSRTAEGALETMISAAGGTRAQRVTLQRVATTP